MSEEGHLPAGYRKSVRLFLCEDVMCGRGIDQVLAHPCSPAIYEDAVTVEWPHRAGVRDQR